jgi:large subunit ribosomal protein L9
MEIILMQDFESLGLEADIIDVAKGYARNYLIPKGFAIEANDANMKSLEMRKGKIMAKRGKDKEAGKLYGSVTSRDIAQGLEKEGVIVDRKKIIIDEAIRSLGESEVAIKLYPEVIATTKVVVEKEEEKAKEAS